MPLLKLSMHLNLGNMKYIFAVIIFGIMSIGWFVSADTIFAGGARELLLVE